MVDISMNNVFHFIIFFLVGFFSRGSGITAFAFMTCFYGLEFFLTKNKFLSRGFLLTVYLFLGMTLHLSLTNLYELTRTTYAPMHLLYSSGVTARCVAMGILIFSIYVLFRYFQRYNKTILPLKAFTLGLTLFLIFAFATGRTTFVGVRLALITHTGPPPIILHPNPTAFLMMLLFYLALIALLHFRSLCLKLLYSCIAIFAFLLMIATMSRSAFLGVLLGIFSSLLFNKKLLIITLCVLCLFLIYSSTFFSEINFATFFLPKRFSIEHMQKKRISDRDKIWEDYLTYATLGNYLVGTGYFASPVTIVYQKPLGALEPLDFMKQNASRFKIPGTHNMFLHVLLMFGIFAFCFFVFMLVYVLKKIYFFVSQGTIHWLYFSMIVSFLFSRMAEHEFLSVPFCISIALFFSKIFVTKNNIEVQ
jgi:O-antigen ligase